MKNCVNCGAPLTGNKCSYCGTEYRNGDIVCSLSEDDYTGTLCVDGKEYRVYLGDMEGHVIHGAFARDLSGRVFMEKSQLKHTFTLIEL